MGNTPPARHAGDNAGADKTPELTERELQLLETLRQGIPNKHIGAQLVIAEGTVKNHLNNIYRKLGASSRLDALMEPRDLGILKPKN